MFSWSWRFFTKFAFGIKKVRFLDLKRPQNRSFWEQNRVQKSIRILDRKKEGPKSRKVPPKVGWRTLSRDILEPWGLWEVQLSKKNKPIPVRWFSHNADGLKPGEFTWLWHCFSRGTLGIPRHRSAFQILQMVLYASSFEIRWLFLGSGLLHIYLSVPYSPYEVYT